MSANHTTVTLRAAYPPFLSSSASSSSVESAQTVPAAAAEKDLAHTAAAAVAQTNAAAAEKELAQRAEASVARTTAAAASVAEEEMEMGFSDGGEVFANGSVHSRLMGATEHNWCRAVAGGTGITVLGLLFRRSLNPSHVQVALDGLQLLHPRLRSQLVWINGRPGFLLSPHPFLKLEVITDTLPQTANSEMQGISVSVPNLQANSDLQISQIPREDAAELSCSAVAQKQKQENSALHAHSRGDSVQDDFYVQREVSEGHFRKGSAGPCSDCAEDQQKPASVINSAEVFSDYDKGGAEPEVESDGEDSEHRDWVVHVENELNENIWPEELNSVAPVPMVVARLFRLPLQRSALILRLHTAVCDRVSAATVISDFLHGLAQETTVPHKQIENQKQNGLNPYQCDGYHVGRDREFSSVDEKISSVGKSEEELGAIEDLIPRGHANKPFWAHGVDLLGYSLGSMRHASLPFLKPDLPRRSALIRSVLTVEQTDTLLQTCKKENTSLFGALGAAGLKAATAMKELGNRSEHFAIISLVNCRQLLDPILPSSTVGFYHSAVLNTHHINEATEFWSLARRCSDALNNAMKNRKHFTDMGNVNFLMSQAIQHPNLTPASSLRTSLLVLFRETVFDDSSEKDLKELVGLEEYMGCSSVHGVGPGLATFECIRNGSLHCTHVYPTPLHSRKQMQKVVNLMMDLLVNSSIA